jgi:tRNA threonylcarbamoyladenosine biosynthesis protein TsaE
MIYISKSESQTITFASKFSRKIQIGSVIALIGNLGSGKTTFTKGFANGLNIKEHVGSPTFKIVSEYEGQYFNLYHIDSYRLNSSKDFLKIGGEEFLNQKTGVTLIEWADLIRDILPQNTIVINFSRLNHENSRRIEIQDY